MDVQRRDHRIRPGRALALITLELKHERVPIVLISMLFSI